MNNIITWETITLRLGIFDTGDGLSFNMQRLIGNNVLDSMSGSLIIKCLVYVKDGFAYLVIRTQSGRLSIRVMDKLEVTTENNEFSITEKSLVEKNEELDILELMNAKIYA